MPFGTGTIEARTWDRREALRDHLRTVGPHEVIGTDAQSPTGFHSIVLRSPDRPPFGYGVISEGHGLRPEVVPIDSPPRLLVGFNADVVGVDATSPLIAFHHRLDALFWTFLHDRAPELTVVIQEIGAMAIAKDGRELWRFSRDLLENWALVGDTLELHFADARPIRLVVTSGSEAP